MDELSNKSLRLALDAIRHEERERCAKVAESIADKWATLGSVDGIEAANAIIEKIRTLKEPE